MVLLDCKYYISRKSQRSGRRDGGCCKNVGGQASPDAGNERDDGAYNVAITTRTGQ